MLLSIVALSTFHTRIIFLPRYIPGNAARNVPSRRRKVGSDPKIRNDATCGLRAASSRDDYTRDRFAGGASTADGRTDGWTGSRFFVFVLPARIGGPSVAGGRRSGRRVQHGGSTAPFRRDCASGGLSRVVVPRRVVICWRARRTAVAAAAAAAG